MRINEDLRRRWLTPIGEKIITHIKTLRNLPFSLFKELPFSDEVKNSLDLRFVKLENVNLKRVNLQHCNLQGANLKRSNLREAYLIHSNLSNADLRRAILGAHNFNFQT